MSARSQPIPFFLVVLFVPAPSLSCSAHSVKLVWAYDSNPRAFRVSYLTSLHLSLCDLHFILLFVFVSAPPSLFKPFTLWTSWDRNATKEVDLWLLHLCFLSWLEVTEHLFGDLTSFLWRVSVQLHWYLIAIAWRVWLATGVPCSGPYHWSRRMGRW